MSAVLPVDVTIDNTLGAVLVGFAVACCIYGILFSQIFSYFVNYPSDRTVYKFLVILILIMETADQAFIGHIIYYYGITNFTNPRVLLRAEVTWSFILQQTVGAFVGFVVKFAFALRVWRFSERNWFITGLVMILVHGLSLAFTIKAFQLPSVFDVVHLRVLGTVALGVGVLTDIIIAAALCYYLNRLRTGYRQSDSLVNSLVRYAINTGAVTGAVSSTTVILYNLMPTNLVFIATYFVLSKLYAISFMATLNTRRVVRGKGTDRQETSNHTNMFHLGTRAPSVAPGALDWDPVYAAAASPSTAPPNSQVLSALTSGSAYSTPDEVYSLYNAIESKPRRVAHMVFLPYLAY
ncbi:hypothetical protein PQX77_005851 [Marasmius sp. AFHP31]|nr:hypothetical protein PQX77_005851 [Marasmius sp. AFHP31]